jgi:hypothetical protein
MSVLLSGVKLQLVASVKVMEDERLCDAQGLS